MNLSCEQCRELLALHVEHNDLLADVASHLQSCANCAREYDNEYSFLSASVSELRALPQMTAPADLRERIRAQIAQEIANASQKSSQKSSSKPRFTIPRPTIPRWATYSLPPFAVAACFMLLLLREPNTTTFSASRDAPDAKAPYANASAANTLDEKPSTTQPNSIEKSAPKTAKTRVQNPSSAQTSTRSASQPLENSKQQKNARRDQAQNNDQNIETQSPATNSNSSSRVSMPQTAQAPPAKSEIPDAIASQNTGKNSRSVAPNRVARKTPLSSSSTPTARLFARLETDQSSRNASNEYSNQHSLPPKTDDSARDSTHAAPTTRNRSLQLPAPVVAPTTSMKNANDHSSNDHSSDDASLEASRNDRSRNDENRDDENRINENSADSRAAQSSVATADSAPQDSARVENYVAGSPASSPSAASPPRTTRSGVAKSGVVSGGTPILPEEFASSIDSASDSTGANSSTKSSKIAPPNATSSNATSSKLAKNAAPTATSSTRENRKSNLMLTLPKTAFLRVQIRWPNSAAQTVWSGRGVLGQKLQIKITLPQNYARNKNARLQVSVQEAAPLPNFSRTIWKTIAREEIAVE